MVSVIALKNYLGLTGTSKGYSIPVGYWISSRGAGVTASRRDERSKSRRLRRNMEEEELDNFVLSRNSGRLGQYEDRRNHNYGRVRSAKGALSVSHRLIAVPKNSALDTEKKKSQERIGFFNSARVVICARRRMRKEVLHAKKKVGSGGGASIPQKKPKYNEFSEIVCI